MSRSFSFTHAPQHDKLTRTRHSGSHGAASEGWTSLLSPNEGPREPRARRLSWCPGGQLAAAMLQATSSVGSSFSARQCISRRSSESHLLQATSVLSPSSTVDSLSGCINHRSSCPASCPAMPIQDNLPWPRDFYDHYMLTEKLGAGQFGNVWRAASRETGAEYAVKVVPKVRADRTRAENLRCVESEVNVWKECQDSDFVSKFEGAYQDDESVYLVSELCSGGDLRAVLADGPLSEGQTAEIMRAVLDVIAVCHNSKHCFGDIKPDNFLLKQPIERCKACKSCSACRQAPRIEVRATDFGCSQTNQECLTKHRRMGSPAYMAPEIWSSSYGLEVDMWAAGVMMYQLISGRYPFWDESPEEIEGSLPMYQVMMAVASNPIHMSGERWDHVSRQAKDLIKGMLDRNVATRTTAEQALRHPWFLNMLGYVPEPPAKSSSERTIRQLSSILSGCQAMFPAGDSTVYSRSGSPSSEAAEGTDGSVGGSANGSPRGLFNDLDGGERATEAAPAERTDTSSAASAPRVPPRRGEGAGGGRWSFGVGMHAAAQGAAGGRFSGVTPFGAQFSGAG